MKNVIEIEVGNIFQCMSKMCSCPKCRICGISMHGLHGLINAKCDNCHQKPETDWLAEALNAARQKSQDKSLLEIAKERVKRTNDATNQDQGKY